MNDSSSLLVLDCSCDDAFAWICTQMRGAGLEVIRTFDLKRARFDHSDCTCPHHGTMLCDCQMIVLLVYSEDRNPISLVAHGHHGRTWLSVVNTPQQRADSRLEMNIRNALLL